MKCIYCGATIGSEEYCTNCGADLTLPRSVGSDLAAAAFA